MKCKLTKSFPQRTVLARALLLSVAHSKRRSAMFYRKNLFAWDLILRILVGVAMVGGGLI